MKAAKSTISAFLVCALAFTTWNCTDHDVSTVAYELDDTSVAQWKGYLKTGYFNEGTIAVNSSDLIIEEGQVKGGSFDIPLSSIINLNLPTPELKQQLTHHLQSADFFNMALHPVVTFNITSVSPFSGGGDNVIAGANQLVTGNLTILGTPHPITFTGKLEVAGDNFKFEALAPFDRTRWGITYATDPTLPDEGSIKPVIDIHLKLSGKKK